MNTITKEEVTALTVTERAAIALQSGKLALELTELADSTKDIVTITNKDGRAQCHAAYMVAKNTRIGIEKLGKAARDDANNFSKACVAEENRLVALIEPEEARLMKLRDGFDAKEKAEKEAKEAAERQRIAAIKKKIDAFAELASNAMNPDAKAADAQAVLDQVSAIEIDGAYAEFHGDAAEARGLAIQRIKETLTAKQAAEAEAERVAAERAQLEAQRIELERQRQEFEALRAAAAPAVEATPEPVKEMPEAEKLVVVDAPSVVDAPEAIAAAEEEKPQAVVKPSDNGNAAVIAAEPVIAYYLNNRAADLPQRQHDFLRAHLVEFVKVQQRFAEARLSAGVQCNAA